MISAMRARVAAAAISALESGLQSLVGSDGAGEDVSRRMERAVLGGGLDTTESVDVGRVECSDERGPVGAPGGPGICFCGAGVGAGAVVMRGMGGSWKPKLGTDGCFLIFVLVQVCLGLVGGSYSSVVSLDSVAGALDDSLVGALEAQRLLWRPDMLMI